jgi:hypothetical protein
MRKISRFWWGGLLLALILSGCGKLERKGPEPVNVPPQVFFANIPPESTKFSISPRVYWYGTDKDGFITAFQYAVIRDSVIALWGGLETAKDSLKKIAPDSASWMDNTNRMDVFGVHLTAEGGSQGNVRLYAAPVETIYTPQYIFLRAVDNEEGASEIKTRMYWRNNHAPQCSINVDSTFVLNNFYCLSETTQTWKGIEINWVGLDTFDYPDKRKQPDFYFKWELWGPYEDTSKLNDPIAKKVISSLDSIKIGGTWLRDEWTLNKSHIFKNLENYSKSDSNYGYGWYQLRVWSRDDAFVSSKDSVTTFFRIIKPLFLYEKPSRRTIALIDHTVYGGDGGAATPTNVLPFYYNAFSQTDDLWDNWELWVPASSVSGEKGYKNIRLGLMLMPGVQDEEVRVEDVLSRQDLVIVLNFGRDPGVNSDYYKAYMNYLNVGGRFWIMGMNNYGVSGTRGEVSLASFDIATKYLGLQAIYYAAYAPVNAFTLEFIGAMSFGSWDFPYLEMDPAKVINLKGYNPLDSGKNFPKNGIPRVPNLILSSSWDFAGRPPLQRRVYSFISRHGRDSEMDQMPCGTTYIGPTFRTAEFSFPLNLMKDGDEENPGAYEAFRKTIEWFWENLP